MTVVRTLTTNLDFNVDFKALKNFNSALDKFSLKFALGGTAAAAFAYQITEAISGVTNLVLDTDALARSTGTAFEQINNLTQAAVSLGRINPQQFQNIFRTVNKDVVDARVGIGRLREISAGLNRSGIRFDIFDNQGRIADTLTIFERMVTAIKQIGDEQLRIRAFEDLLKFDGAELDRIFKDGYEAFSALAATFEQSSKALKEATPFAENYEKNLREISQSLDETVQNFVIKFSPVILKFSEAIREITDLYNKFSRGTDNLVQGTANALKGDDGLLSIYGRGLLPDLDYADAWSPVPGASSNSPVNVENIFQVTLPPGTPQEQGRALFDATTEALTGWIQNQAQMIQNNNPQVE